MKGKADSIVSSFNRNFPGRNDGINETLSFLASPEVVTAYASSGDLAFDPVNGKLKGADGKEFRLEPPQGEELPAKGFAKGEEGFVAPAQTATRSQSMSRRPASGYSCCSRSRAGTERISRSFRC